MNVERRVKTMRLIHAFNIVLLHNKVSIYLRQNFTSINHHDCNTRSANNLDFRIPSIKQYQDKTFYYNAIKDWNDLPLNIKAILQVLIYKALYDKSYLGSKTTMTSGEWTCLISFATAPFTCSERGGSEKFKMKIYVSSGIRTHTPPFHDRKVAAP